jgi:hypothetical protein
MSRWMLELFEKERERRAKVAAFMKAGPGFMDDLEKELKSGMDAYTQQFPVEGADIKQERSDGRILMANMPTKIVATVSLNAITQRVACSFENVRLASDWEWPLDVANDGAALHLMGIDQAGTVKRLARNILIPVLFPGLLSDPATRRHLAH